MASATVRSVDSYSEATATKASGPDGIIPKPASPIRTEPGNIRQSVARTNAGPVNPLEQEKQGEQPFRWAPTVARNSADGISGRIPWPEIKRPAAPFKLR